jgi:hypothetical protein
MAHADARLTDFGRLLVQRITELGWPPPQAAESLGVSRATAYKWLCRNCPRAQRAWPTDPRGPIAALCSAGQPGPSGAGRPSAPPPEPPPARLPPRDGPLDRLWGPSRHGMSRLAHTDRASGAVVRYQREHPGELVHLDVMLGRIPDGGGHRIHGRVKGPRGRGIGYGHVHSAVDDRSRVAFSQILPTRPARPRPGSWSRQPASSPITA